jgi:hypothetical protein
MPRRRRRRRKGQPLDDFVRLLTELDAHRQLQRLTGLRLPFRPATVKPDPKDALHD